MNTGAFLCANLISYDMTLNNTNFDLMYLIDVPHLGVNAYHVKLPEKYKSIKVDKDDTAFNLQCTFRFNCIHGRTHNVDVPGTLQWGDEYVNETIQRCYLQNGNYKVLFRHNLKTKRLTPYGVYIRNLPLLTAVNSNTTSCFR